MTPAMLILLIVTVVVVISTCGIHAPQTRRNYIPNRDAQFNEFFKKMVSVLTVPGANDLTISTTAVGGKLTAAGVTVGGTGYSAGQIIGPITGGTGGFLQVSSVAAGVVTGLTVLLPGSGYTTAAGPLATTVFPPVGTILPADYTALNNQYGIWNAAWANFNAPNGKNKNTVQIKNDEKLNSTRAIRLIVNKIQSFVYSDNITNPANIPANDTFLNSMDLPRRNTIRTEPDVPTQPPFIKVAASGPNTMVFEYSNNNFVKNAGQGRSRGTQKPYGVDSVQIAVSIPDLPDGVWEINPMIFDATRSPTYVPIPEAAVGMRLFYKARYKMAGANKNGGKARYSEFSQWQGWTVPGVPRAVAAQ